MIHNLKPLLLTAVITTSTIIFINTLLGTVILLLTYGYWVQKNISLYRKNKKENG